MTRAALLTPPIPAGLATIQIVGPAAQPAMDAIFIPTQYDSFGSILSDRLHFGKIVDGDDTIDEVIVASDPAALTVDISCHGGPRIVQRILLLIENHGVEITTWQQLSSPASIAEEVARTLPQTITRLGALAITAQHPTGLTAFLQETLATLTEYPETLNRIKDRLAQLLPTYALAQKLLTPATVVLTGPANVGKSTLANALAGRGQSIAADQPGTTRDHTEQIVDIAGVPVRLIDTAGQRQPQDQLESQALASAQSLIATADLAIMVHEPATIKATPKVHAARHTDGAGTAAASDEAPPSPLLVINKSDVLPPKMPPKDYLAVSALKSIGLDQLRHAIAARLGFINFDPATPLIFTANQHQLLTEAATADTCEQAAEALQTLLATE